MYILLSNWCDFTYWDTKSLKYRKIDIFSCSLSDQHGLKLEVNSKATEERVEAGGECTHSASRQMY